MDELCLHLGCGDYRISEPGWVNVDTRMHPGVTDRVDNIGILRRYAKDSVDKIYCCHALDHFSRWDYPRVLKRWHEILKPGGSLTVVVVDFAVIARLYLEKKATMRELLGSLVAAQDYESNVRHVHWDFDTLRVDLLLAGFDTIYRLHETPHDDCSKAEIAGVQTSLIVAAYKKLR